MNGNIVVLSVDVKPLVDNNTTELLNKIVEPKSPVINYYRVVSVVHKKFVKRRYNVFSEQRANELIKKNLNEVASFAGRYNALAIHAVYKDNSEVLIYKTGTLEK